MSYILYYSPDSANLVVRMVLEEMGLEYEERPVPSKRTERSDVFFELNPRGLLPVLIDEQESATLFETGAILIYLADKHSTLGLDDEGRKGRGDCLRWVFMMSNTLHADLAIRFYPERYVCTQSEIKPLQAAMKRRVQKHLELIDDVLGGHDGMWFLEKGLSVCDFYLGCCLRWAQRYPADAPAIGPHELEKMANLTATLTALQERPSVKNAMMRENLGGSAFVGVHTEDAVARVFEAVGEGMP